MQILRVPGSMKYDPMINCTLYLSLWLCFFKETFTQSISTAVPEDTIFYLKKMYFFKLCLCVFVYVCGVCALEDKIFR